MSGRRKGDLTASELAGEIEHQLNMAQGWGRILQIAKQNNTDHLARKLRRAGRNDLANTIESINNQGTR